MLISAIAVEFEVLYMVSAQVTQPFTDMEYQLLHVKY